MRKIIILFIIFFIVIFLLLTLLPRFLTGSDAENLTFNNIKSAYNPNEDIIISGRAPKNTDMIIFFNGELSLSKSDNRGYWSADLGKADEGRYGFQAVARVSPDKDLVQSTQIIVAKNNVNFSQKLTYYFMA